MNLLAWLAVLLLTAAFVGGGWHVRRRRRQAGVRLRHRRVLNELDEVGVDEVEAFREPDADGELTCLGRARVAAARGEIIRRDTSFFVLPEEGADWGESEQPLVLRFTKSGIAHEVRCRILERARLGRRQRLRWGTTTAVVYRLAPAGVIVKRERRDMMRFFVGDTGARPPRGSSDARRFVELAARLWATDLELAGDGQLPRVLDTEAARPVDPAGYPMADDDDGGAATVLDFSGTGIRVEASMGAVAQLVSMDDDASVESVLRRLDERALLVALDVDLDFPPKVQELEPAVPPRTWMLAEVARVSLVEGEEDEDDRVRLGLAMLYQPRRLDAADDRPLEWERVGDEGEADDLVAIHNALNQAAAQMQAESL